MRYFFLILLFLSCSPQQEKGSFLYTEQPATMQNACSFLCFGKVTAKLPVSCQYLQFNILTAQELLHQRGIMSKEEFCTAFKGVEIEVQDAYSWTAPLSPTEVGGQYTCFPKGIMYVDRGSGSLMHEMLHHIDILNFNWLTPLHVNWNTNGFDAASEEYRQDYQPIFFKPKKRVSFP
jgi:hypothetical protein